LGQPNFDFSAPLIQRAVEEIVHHIQPARFIRLQLIDIAVLKTQAVNASCSVEWSISSVHFTNSQWSYRVKMLLPRKSKYTPQSGRITMRCVSSHLGCNTHGAGAVKA
jgi:hypothetical protein